MSYVDELKALIQEYIESVTNALDRAERSGPRAIRRAIDNSFPNAPRPQFLNDAMADAMIGQLHDAVGLVRRGVEVLDIASKAMGSPDTLRTAAGRLSSDVAAVCESLGSDVRLDNLKAVLPSAWDDGDASAQYAISFDGQSRAVDKIREYALLFSDSLNSMADGIEEYYGELAKAIGSMAVAVVSAVLAIVTIETGVGTVVFGIGAFLNVAQAVMSAVEVLEAATKDRGETFRDKISDIEWPAARFAVS